MRAIANHGTVKRLLSKSATAQVVTNSLNHRALPSYSQLSARSPNSPWFNIRSNAWRTLSSTSGEGSATTTPLKSDNNGKGKNPGNKMKVKQNGSESSVKYVRRIPRRDQNTPEQGSQAKQQGNRPNDKGKQGGQQHRGNYSKKQNHEGQNRQGNSGKNNRGNQSNNVQKKGKSNQNQSGGQKDNNRNQKGRTNSTQKFYRKTERKAERGKPAQKKATPVLSDLDKLLGRVTPSQSDSEKTFTKNKSKKKDKLQKSQIVREVTLPEVMGLRWLSEESGLDVARLLFTMILVHAGGIREAGDEFQVATAGVGYRMGMAPLSGKNIKLLEDAAQSPSLRNRHDVRRAVQQAAGSLLISQEVAALMLLEFDVLAEFEAQVDLDEYPTPTVTRGPEYDALPLRAPVVTVMGHVDHGKTTLLDTMRSTNVAEGESGGITQAVGAFNVTLDQGDRVVFVDTPGHEAFSSMRQSGTAVTDIVVLVVAATDGLRPQTLESIKLAEAAEVPIVVALTKVDMPGIDPDTAAYTVAADLQLQGVETELVGGSVPLVPVAAPIGMGMRELTETILLQAESMELRAPQDTRGEAVVLEAFVDRHRGAMVDAIVRRGTLRPGDVVVAGTQHAKIRQLLDPVTLEQLYEAPPSTPVRIVGLKDGVPAGASLLAVPDDRRAKEVAEYRVRKDKFSQLISVDKQVARTREKLRQERILAKQRKLVDPDGDEDGEELLEDIVEAEIRDPIIVPVVVKADTSGSLAALQHSLEGLSLQLSETEEGELERLEGVKPTAHSSTSGGIPLLPFGSEIRIIRSGVGPLTQQDVDAAATAGCSIFGFNVRAPAAVDREASQLNVKITTQSVIYHLLDDLKKVFLGHMEAVVNVKVNGSATVAQVFDMNGKRSTTWRVAGCHVNSGEMSKSQRIRVLRNGEVIHNSSGIDSLKVFKENKKIVSAGQECGISLTGFQDFQVGDVIESYEEEVVKYN